MGPLRNRPYRHLFAAQVVALAGTGLATVALSLLAYDVAGSEAGSVLGTAMAIKMVAYVGLAPVITAVAHRIPRRSLLVSADLTRLAVALALPLVDQVWQIYVLIFLLQTASAAFTPAFQSLIPEVLPAERDYTRALSLSRLAYDLESVFSPALAAGLLALVSYDQLFLGTAAGFLGSAVLVVSAVLPGSLTGKRPDGEQTGTVLTRTTLGARLFWSRPRLRALFVLNFAVAAAGATVIVNTVVYVRDHLDRADTDVPFALGAYGAGSMFMAILLPRLLDRRGERAPMLGAAFALTGLLAAVAATSTVSSGTWRWPVLLALWALLGTACSMILTPTGNLIRRSAAPGDLPAVFAAQFSFSHAAWLVSYPIAGWVGATAGLPVAAAILSATAGTATILGWRIWPRETTHIHTGLDADHPHLADARAFGGGWQHRHHDVVDALHPGGGRVLAS